MRLGIMNPRKPAATRRRRGRIGGVVNPYLTGAIVALVSVIPTAAASARPVPTVPASTISAVVEPARTKTITAPPEPATTLTAVATPAVTPAGTLTPTKPAVKATSSQAPAAVKPAVPQAARSLSVVVNPVGGQSVIDRCLGPVLYAGVIIAQHDYCGGTRYYALSVGSLVSLSGTAVRAGIYRVSSIANNRAGSSSFAMPSQYLLETCVGTGGAVRLWYIERV